MKRFLLPALAVLSGCPDEEPIQVPIVVTFSTAFDEVSSGATVRLNWHVRDAVQIRINTDGGGLITEQSGLIGSVETPPLEETTVFILTAIGSDQLRAQSVVVVQVTDADLLGIDSFTVSPDDIYLGEVATISWTVRNATAVEVIDKNGAVIYEGQALSANQGVAPFETNVYTLNATDGFTTVSETAVLIVHEPEPARVIAFSAQPPQVPLGGTSTLTWVVENAAQVEIRSGGITLHTSFDSISSFPIIPFQTTTYELVALNLYGDTRDLLTVVVYESAPLIVDFSADPNPTALGGTTRLSWNVVGAFEIVLREGGQELLRTGETTGFFDVEIEETQTVFTLIALNDFWESTESITVIADAAPVIARFTADALAFSGSADVVLDWEVQGATGLWLSANGVPVPAFPGAASGTIAVTIEETTIFELTAVNGFGAASSQVAVAEIAAESEPNDTASTADLLTGITAAITGTIAPSDVDFFAVDVQAGGWIRATVSSPSCAPLNVVLLDRDGVTERGQSAGALGVCPRIEPILHAFARNLAGGRYYLRIDPSGVTTPYQLIVQLGAPACGNSIPELGEACEDGNRAGGDGCSPRCSIEPAGVVESPSDTTFSGTLAANEAHLYQVDMLTPGYIRAETFAPVAPSCGADTELSLYDEDGGLLDFDQDGGIDLCSRLVAAVAEGSYLVEVRLRSSADYSVRIEALEYGCGNGILEPGELCDDGNQLPNDGCNPTCAFEGPSEVEPNDASGDSGVITSSASATFGGSLPAGDVDFWALTVPEGWSISAALTVGGSNQCQPGPDAPRLILYAPDGETELSGDVVELTETECPRIDPAVDRPAADLDAGTYFVSVAAEGINASISEYALSLAIIAPVCPNAIRDGDETCDDGNLVSGDGCDASCQIEPEAVILLPAPEPFSAAGAISAGEDDIFRIDVAPGPGRLLSVQTFLPDEASGCQTGAGDTVIELFDADFHPVASNDDLPPTLCSMLERVVLDGGATYYLVVRAYAATDSIPAYEVVIDSQPVNVCGNGLTEASNNEQCDDGNGSTGDGCNPACDFEIAATFGPPGGSTTVTVPAGAFTTLRLNLTQPGQSITATAAIAGACVAALRVRLLDAGFGDLGASGNPPFPTNACAVRFPVDRFAFDLAPGTYHLRIEGGGTIDVDAAIIDADCGDGNVNARIGEACDDGNVAPGDGCDAACMFEGNVGSETEVNDNQSTADPTSLSGIGSVVVAGAVSASGDDDVFSFTVPANTTLSFSARTHSFLNDPTSCDNTLTDTRIFLEAAGAEAFVPNSGELAYSDDVSVANPAIWCSQIANVPLSAGTYYVRVQGYNDAITPMYFMTLTLQ